MKLATCQTSDAGDGTPCSNYGIGFVWDDQAAQAAADENDAVHGGIICGPCGQPITDLTDAPADAKPGTFIFPEPPAGTS